MFLAKFGNSKNVFNLFISCGNSGDEMTRVIWSMIKEKVRM